MPKSIPPALPPIDFQHDDAEVFELAPVSLWLEDYSAVKALLEAWRRAGVTSLRDHLAANPSRVRECASRIRVLKVNRKTLTLYGAESLDRLVENLDCVFRDDMLETHVEELVHVPFDSVRIHIRSFPRKRESSPIALGPRFRGDERVHPFERNVL